MYVTGEHKIYPHLGTVYGHKMQTEVSSSLHSQLQICNHDLPITAAALWAPVTSSAFDRELDDEAPLLLATCCRATIVLSHVHPSLTESSVVWRHKLAATGAQPVSPSNACFDSITCFLLAVALGREVLVLRVEYVDTLFGSVHAPVRLTCTFICGVLQRSRVDRVQAW